MAYDDIQLMRPPSFAERLLDDVRDWCRGRMWVVRIPLLLYFCYIGIKQFGDPMYTSIFGGLNLGIHEGGHLLFRSGGQFLYVAGGTILQLFAPLASMIMFFRQRDYFAIAVCLGWLGTNFAGVGLYMADAEKMVLPLVTVGDSPIVTHDWRFLFTKFGLLSHCEGIGGLMRGLGHLSILFCVIAGSWLCWMMYRLPPKPKPTFKV